jgi:protein-tyrosine phosphatase
VTTRVLVVCTGNVCRSPAAELLLRDRLGAADVDVASAGVHALAGQPVDPPVAELLAERGVSPEGFRARQLDPAEAGAADVVLTMTREHRAAVVRARPGAVRRTLLLPEAAEAAAAIAREGWPADLPDVAARLAALPRLATRHRGAATAAAAAEVPDPHRQSAAVHRRTVDLLAGAVDTLVTALGTGARPIG